MKRSSLMWQIALPVAAVLLASLATVSGLSLRQLTRFHEERSAQDLRARAYLLGEWARDPIQLRDWDAVDRLCDEAGRRTETRFTIVLPDGRVAGDSEQRPADMVNHADRPEVRDALERGWGRSQRFSETLQRHSLYVALSIPGRESPLGVVRASMPLTTLREIAAAAWMRVALTAALVSFAGVALGLIVVRRVSRRLADVVSGARRYAQGDLRHRIPPADVREFGSIVDTMNHMAAELDHRIETITQQRNELDALWLSLKEAIVVIDSEMRVLRMNRRAAALLETDPVDARGRGILDIVRPAPLRRCIERLLSDIEGGDRDAAPVSDGRRSLLLRAAPLRDTSGASVGATVILSDVTRLHQMEQAHRALLTGVAHELRTPVTAMRAAVETLMQGADADSEARARFLGSLAAQAERLGALVEDVLAVVRLQDADQAPSADVAPARLAFVLADAVEQCRPQAEARSISLNLACPTDLAAPVNADLVRRAVANLVDNAVRNSHADGRVAVEASIEGNTVAIRVEDAGRGIESGHLDHLFDAFYRVDASRARSAGGTGLGLTIVKLVAACHGGRVAVTSAPGQGSAFTLYLPR